MKFLEKYQKLQLSTKLLIKNQHVSQNFREVETKVLKKSLF